MAAYVTRKLLSGLALVLLLTLLCYLAFDLISLHPACLRVACGPDTYSTDADIRAADHQLGVDRPIVYQYARFLWRFLRHGRLGTTWIGETSVNQAIASALPVTASIVLGGVALLLLLALPLGFLAALRPRSPADRGLLAVSVLGIAIHPFVLAIIIQTLLGSELGIPSGGYCPLFSSSACGGPADWASRLYLPWLCFALFFLPLYMRMIRVRLLETLGEPYVVTARAKGASEWRVISRHVLRNAISPVLPMVAADAGTALTAAIYIEVIFAAPGLGQLAVHALSGTSGGYDRPLIVGIVATVAVFVVALNVASDIAGAWLDPRRRDTTSSGLIRLPRLLTRTPLALIPRPVTIAFAFVALIVAGFAIYTSGTPTGRIALVGPVRTINVNWQERHRVNGFISDRIAVRVSKIQIGRRGWRVAAAFTALAREPITIERGGTTIRDNGLGLVYSYRDAGYNQLRILNASNFNPPLPSQLKPGESWHGSFSGIEAVPPGAQFFVGFGAFDVGGNGISLTSFLTSHSAVTPH